MNEEDLLEVKISDISVTKVGFALIFKPVHYASSEAVPIFIGPLEAYSISNEIQGIKNQRPNTHDLMINILNKLEARILKVIINDLVGNIFYATIIIQFEDNIYKIDARPSDSVALAIRIGCPIFMHKKVFKESAVILTNGEEESESTLSQEEVKEMEPSRSKLEILQEKLQKAIEIENYEEAAKLRDEIKKLKNQEDH